jgi:hypothetical protein
MSTPDQVAQELHQSSLRLGSYLDSLIFRATRLESEARSATPEQMNGLLSELIRAGETLRRLPSAPDTEIQAELAEYRRIVTRLRDLLPAIHRALLQERTRLEAERDRLQSASQWARVSRETL